MITSFVFGDARVSVIAHSVDETKLHNAIVEVEGAIEDVYYKHELIDLVSLNLGFNPLQSAITSRNVRHIGGGRTLLKWGCK